MVHIRPILHHNAACAARVHRKLGLAMPVKSTITVERLPDGRVSIGRGTWSDTFSEGRREPWAAWYEQMFSQYGYAGYRDMAEALGALPAA